MAPSGRRRRTRSVNEHVAEVAVERRRLAVEVGHGEVGPAVAVEVAAATPMPAW